MSAQTRPWWQTAVIYQIYPRSLQDSNGDGIGDLPGILARLDYFVHLGVDALWLSPIYPSPMADFGYDVADYTGVDPIFGTLHDLDDLLSAVHQRGLKLILDFVPNHSSNQHPWFLESRSSRTDPKRDWYIWRDPSGPPTHEHPHGQLPNNWLSHFGGPAWTFDETTQQFYLHSFLPEQPDLNWRNLAVKAAIFAALRIWLDRGIDGFRMDVLWLLIKDDQFRDNPPNPAWPPGSGSYGRLLPIHTENQPETHAIVREMRALLDSYPGDRLLIGEIYLPLPELVTYYGQPVPPAASLQEATPTSSAGSPPPLAQPLAPNASVATAEPTSPQQVSSAEPVSELPEAPELRGAQMPFNFHLILSAWNAETIAGLIRDYEALLPPGAWPNWVLGNHDKSRLATRIGPAQARVAAMLLLTLRGTPTLYNGDELGMSDGMIPPELVQDPAEKNQPGIGLGRDPERTPMPWDATPRAGFTTGHPWLPINPDHTTVNVRSEWHDTRSVLALYRQLLELRRTHPALHSGSVQSVSAEDGVLRYTRMSEDPATPERFEILLNFTDREQNISTAAAEITLTTLLDGAGAPINGSLTLEAGEGVLLRLTSRTN